MRTPGPLPETLATAFTIQDAEDAGASRSRLRRTDLDAPFHGVRSRPQPPIDHDDLDVFGLQSAERRLQSAVYAPRMRPHQFFSHETAVAIHGGPLPLVLDDGEVVDGRSLPVHVSTFGPGPLVRTEGVRAHRADPRTTRIVDIDGCLVADPATAWAQLGAWSVPDLVALGDYLCRVWRPGYGRPGVGTPAMTTVSELRERIAGVRRRGIRRLREAVDLIREDSWSPRESKLRCLILRAGLPEPALNQDIYDDHGRFLGCFDLTYPDLKLAIEYHGLIHAANYAKDVERIAALRAAGWTVIEVTSALYSQPEELLRRIRSALGIRPSFRSR
ncbi:hypothetical protein [Microbacterium sp.]|uniref:hypothetical protein n=1 Tax=Microbacterium sp. TaxID=51671 RepID=UPI003A92AD55